MGVIRGVVIAFVCWYMVYNYVINPTWNQINVALSPVFGH